MAPRQEKARWGFELAEPGEKKEKRKEEGGSGQELNLGRPDVEKESWLKKSCEEVREGATDTARSSG